MQKINIETQTPVNMVEENGCLFASYQTRSALNRHSFYCKIIRSDAMKGRRLGTRRIILFAAGSTRFDGKYGLKM